ncbi:serine/threonine-protein kinase CDL1-like isoform X1 [Tripterygium wilfordii]|uniref:Serine/threonine-protein kinase CDL1-like isoform X1 n=1 Tax=Tripterygium wilfordii TaxID=458696 RepID=A0A7J7DHL2_TRIWF|nr:serine/threonine-protein kinase CDL1-like isoform X1 [Tripterygium wilfordii]
MLGNRRFHGGPFSLLGSKEQKKRTIVVGLKSDNSSRDMLLRVLVEIDFLVKVCTGETYIAELTHQVRVNGRILLRRQGIYMHRSLIIESSISPSKKASFAQPIITNQLKKCITTAPSSPTSSPKRNSGNTRKFSVNEDVQCPDWLSQKLFQRLAILEANGSSKRFTSTELNAATNNFSPAMFIAEGTNSMVYKANLVNGLAVAVKVLKNTHWSAEDLFQEVETLSSIKHENIVRIVGYCICRKMNAVVYDLLMGSLKQTLRTLKWSERMRIAVDVARALDHLHHCCNPPIIHRDVKSSNILLSNNYQSLLSDFGAAMVHNQSEENSENMKPLNVVGTFGYLAPEYMMCGKIDEKVDVYSYGVVLLELITGKEAIQKNQANNESLVLWASSLLSRGLWECLIDPELNREYDKKEMEMMMFMARLCLTHSSWRRPTMKVILRVFEEPEYWQKMQSGKHEFLDDMAAQML